MIEWLNDNSGAVQAIAVVVLVIVTAVYVIVTAVYAVAARRQADANVRMVEEMREQRLSGDQPTVILRLVFERLAIGAVRPNEERDLPLPPIVGVQAYNAGRGPAVELVATMVRTGWVFMGEGRGYLRPGEDWDVDLPTAPSFGDTLGWEVAFLGEVGEPGAVHFVVAYQDIHRRQWVSYLHLDYDADTDLQTVSCVGQGVVKL
jgi:hypothetical protein